MVTNNSQHAPAAHSATHERAMPWVINGLRGLKAPARVLDLACGNGRHSRLALSMGLSVLAVDRDRTGLDSLLEMRIPRSPAAGQGPDESVRLSVICQDLETQEWSFADQRFQAVIVTHYLFRPRLAALVDLLEPGGRLIYATFAQGNERFGRPRNPDFLLAEGELLEMAARSGLIVAAYEAGESAGTNPAQVQRLLAWRPGPVHTRPILGDMTAQTGLSAGTTSVS